MKVLSVLKEEVRIMRIESHPNLASITLVALFLVFTPFYPSCADIISQLSMLCGGPSAVKLVTLLINVAFSVHMSACAFWRIKVSKTFPPISYPIDDKNMAQKIDENDIDPLGLTIGPSDRNDRS